jgi:phosphoglycerol transferase MdoB-like AlkP superfamily enzyme
MTIPTNSTFWHQSELNKKYGIDKLYSLGKGSWDSWANDSVLFSEVVKELDVMSSPFFHVIVTISMHGTYSDMNMPQTDTVFPFIFPKHYSNEFQNYLKKCYYTDRQIGRYLDYLKKIGKYDNTIIIVVSDHEVPKEVNMDEKSLNNLALPLIISHAGIEKEKLTTGPIHQIDVYPTLLDLLGLTTPWHGVGCSILRNYQYSEISDSTKMIADKLLRGNYLMYLAQ